MNLRDDPVVVWTDRRRGHRFQPPKADLKGIPALNEGDATDPVVHLHFFHQSWDWWVTELDQDTGVAFGLVDGFEREWGYIDLPELARVIGGPLGMPVERDCHWTRKRASEL